MAALLFTAALGAQAPPQDPMLQAMHDEAVRSSKLNLPNLEAPYFVEYVVDEAESFSVMASLGGVVSRRRDRFRAPDVYVRVGDYKLDNSNFGGAGSRGSRYDLEGFPIENSYEVFRRYLWLETDSAYKAALDAISRKRAAMRNVTQNEQLHDFAHAEPVQYVRPFSKLSIDEDAWTNRVRALSAIFGRFPEIKDSDVEMEASTGGYYVVNSEGTDVKAPENVTYVRAHATAQASDGTTLHDTVTFQSLDLEHMASENEMTRDVTAMAGNLAALAHAPKGEDYNGPVLFESVAGAQVFAEVLGKNLTLARRPIGGRGGAAPAGDLEGRLGARVLPESFDVVDDPAQKEWRGRPLFGSYDVDREGVPAKPLRLVEKGVLKGYLLTRQPVRGFEGSNGRARLPGSYGTNSAGIGNLFVSSSETTPAAEMKKKLIDLIQARNKPYGILVRKMDFPSSADFSEARAMLQASQGEAHPVSMPLLVYKVYPDGREELVRGMRFKGFNARALRDILAAGDDSSVLEFMDNTAPFALIGGAQYTSEACVVAPSILIDDLELHPAEEEQPKLPLVPAPDISR